MQPCLIKTLIFLFIFLISQNLLAQVFAPNEAEWYYTDPIDGFYSLEKGYQKIWVVGDTLIDGKNCEILQKREIGYDRFSKEYYNRNVGRIFVYTEDSIVYYQKGDQFYTLYDFTANPGESFETIGFHNCCTNAYVVNIDSVTFINNNSKTLKKFYVNINDSVYTYYIEGIGYEDYLIPPFFAGCNPPTPWPRFPAPLRCYYDNKIGYFKTEEAPSCDYITHSKELSMLDKSIKLFPNPSKVDDVINIEINDIELSKISVFSLSGKMICYYEEITQPIMEIQIGKPGIYCIQLEDKKGNKLNKKLIIE